MPTDVNTMYMDIRMGDYSSLKKAGETLTGYFKRAIETAREAAFGPKALRQMQDLYNRSKGHTERLAALESQLRERGLNDEERKRLSMLVKEEKEKLIGVEDRMKMEEKRLEGIAKKRKDFHERVAKTDADTIRRGVDTAIQKFTSADYSSIGQDIAKSFFGAGRAARGAAARAREKEVIAGRAGPGMGGLGGVVKALGTVGVAIGALTAAVAGIVALFGVLDEKAKEFNKTVLESGGIADMGFRLGKIGAGELGEELKEVRDVVTDVSNNMKWMTLGKEQMEILRAFQEAGYRLKDMREEIEGSQGRMRSFADVTAVALTYSKLLGVESTKMAADMGTIMADTGLQLEQVRDGFSRVARIAQESGFNTKRFYTAVLEATSGTHYYNIRIEEAAELLKRMSNILGKRPGKEFFDGIKEGFAELTMEERHRQILIAGRKGVTRIAAAEADKAANRFADTLVKNQAFAFALQEVGRKYGIKIEKGGKGVAEQLARMTGRQWERFSSELENLGGVGGELWGELKRIRELQGARSGDVDKIKGALDDFSETGAIAMKMMWWKGSPIHLLNTKQLGQFEKVKGITGKALESLLRISTITHGSYNMLREEAKNVKAGRKEGVKGNDILSEELAEQTRRLGYIVDENAKIRRATVDDKGAVHLGEEIKNLEEYQVHSDAVVEAGNEALEEQITEDQRIAQEIADNTEPLSKILKLGVEHWLHQIHTLLAPIKEAVLNLAKKFLFGEAHERMVQQEQASKKQAEAMEENNRILADAEKASKVIERRRSELQKELVEAGKSGDKELAEKLQEEIDRISGMGERIAEVAKSEEEIRGLLRSMEASEFEMFGGATRKIGSLRDAVGSVWAGEISRQSKLGAGHWGGDIEYVEKLERGLHEDRVRKAEEWSNAQIKEIGDSEKDSEKHLEGAGSKAIARRVADALSKTSSERRVVDFLRSVEAEEEDILTVLGLFQKGQESTARKHARDVAVESLRSMGYFDEVIERMAPEFLAAGVPIHKIKSGGDFIITDRGEFIKPHASDTIIGMRPGGPLSGARGAQITVNVYESHNPEKTYQTVKRVLREARLI